MEEKVECSRRGNNEQELWRIWQQEIRTEAEVKLRWLETLNKNT